MIKVGMKLLATTAAGAVAAILCAPPAHAMVYTHFLNVGQGDATLIQTPECTILVDAGRHSSNDVVPLLRERGVESVDILVGTHPHADHIGQFSQVIEEYQVTEAWMSGWDHSTQTYIRALEAIEGAGIGYHEPRAGDSEICGSLVVNVFGPASDPGDIHDGIVMRIAYGDFSLMVTGDAEEEHEHAMIRAGTDLQADVLQLGHHGSSTSTTGQFLEAVSPSLAIYSGGVGNSYGHPHRSVIDRLQRAGVRVHGTATSGTITVASDGQGRLDWLAGDHTAAPGTGVAAGAGEQSDDHLAADLNSCIDLNEATAKALTQIIQIGDARAEAIKSMRPWATVAELTRINGIGEATLRSIVDQDLACIGGSR